MNKDNVSKDLISVVEAAELMGYSRQHTLRLIDSGKIKATRVGRAYLVERKSLPNIFETEITAQEKKEVDQAVDKVFKKYGDVIRKLGKE